MLDRHPFGTTGRTGCINYVRQRLGSGFDGFMAGRTDVLNAERGFAKTVGEFALRQDNGRFGVSEHEINALLGIAGIEGNVCPARFENPQDPANQVQVSLHANAD